MKKPGVDLPVLIGQDGPLNGQRWQVADTIVIGREADCNIMIPERQISRYHARIMPLEQGGASLEDLGSKNGTYLNGVMVNEPVDLHDGDLIQLALIQHFVYLSSDATMPLEGALLPGSGTKTINAHLSLDQRSRRVWLGNQELIPPLSLAQFRMLELLYEHAGQVVSRQDLIQAVWKNEEIEGVSEQALDALVRRLRDRLALINPEHIYMVTVRGHGIRLDNPAE